MSALKAMMRRMQKQCVRCLAKSVVHTVLGAGIHKSKCPGCRETTLHRYTYLPDSLVPDRPRLAALLTPARK